MRFFVSGLLLAMGVACASANPYVVSAVGQGAVDSLRLSVHHVPEEEYVLAEFDVSSDCRLYLHGERVLHARLTSSPGDSLRMNGMPFRPARGGRPRAVTYESLLAHLSDDTYEQAYASIPYVVSRVSAGAAARDAVGRYEYEQWDLLRRLVNAYVEAREVGEPPEVARASVRDRLPALDTERLVDPTSTPVIVDGVLRVSWLGAEAPSRDQEVPLTVRWGILPELSYDRWLARRVILLSGVLSAEGKREIADSIRGKVSASADRPCLYFIRRGATLVSTVNHDGLREFDRQLEEARTTGVLPDGPHRRDIGAIIEREKSRLSN